MFCDREEAWLSEKGISFTLKDVLNDEEALDELEKLGAFSTPVTLIDGEAVIGFDRKRLIELLNITISG